MWRNKQVWGREVFLQQEGQANPKGTPGGWRLEREHQVQPRPHQAPDLQGSGLRGWDGPLPWNEVLGEAPSPSTSSGS